MTIITSSIITSSPATFATVDLYRDIHKGIRAELFAITTAAGSVDPSRARSSRAALADHVESVCGGARDRTPITRTSVIDPVLADAPARGRPRRSP